MAVIENTADPSRIGVHSTGCDTGALTTGARRGACGGPSSAGLVPLVVLFGWFTFAIRLGLPSAEPVGFLPFVFVAFALHWLLGRWLAHTGAAGAARFAPALRGVLR